MLSLIASSKSRREILFYLEDGPKTHGDIKEHLHIGSPQLSLKIRELSEHNPISVRDRTYSLTTAGKVFLKNYRPLADTVELLEKHDDFWKSHEVSDIPDELLCRIGELHGSLCIEDDVYNMKRTWEVFVDIVRKARYIYGVSSIFDESIVALFSEVETKGIPISIVLCYTLYNRLMYECPELIFESTKFDNLEIYVSDVEIKTPFILTNDYICFSPYLVNGKFDLHSNLVGHDESSMLWGRDLFEYYRARSIKI